ncbi:DUF305 domain-containing protein [Ramlibacter sp. PS3R-8]|uniref:DUF305 domain-containing protein n=1 Tax=Ramlibacter sp. PS3R-8 TaxID=3133437 RepID=UPI0030AA0EFA
MIKQTRIRNIIGSLMFATALTAAPAAVAQAHQQHGASAATSSPMDMKSMMKEMNDKMNSMPMTGKPDIDFAMMMRVHHQGAIHMAEAELKAGKEPEMRKMAQKVIAAQKKEIAELDKFLAKHGHPAEKK